MWQDLLSLDALVNPDAPVFRSRTGKALDRSRVLRIVQEAAKRAGLREVSMANYQVGLNVAVLEVLIRLPGCATSSSYSFI